MKKYIALLFTVIFTAAVFAQEGNIDLPDLTTIVTGDTSEIDKIEAPDFSDVVMLPGENGNIVPELPEIEIIEGEEIVVASADSDEKKIYAEGKIGGGYPAYFIGDFSVSKIYGDNPFKIRFFNSSSAGYASSKRAEGYYDTETFINLDKTFTFNNKVLNLYGNYEETGNGLQSKVESISSIKQDSIGGIADFQWFLPHNFTLSSKIDSNFYYRFSDVTANSSEDFACPDWIKKNITFKVEPTLGIAWENDAFSTGFTALYDYVDDTHRGDFNLDFSWKNDFIKLYSSAGFIIGNNLNENIFMVPFTLGVQTSIPVYFSDRKLGITLEGGMKTWQNTIESLEKEYKFTAFETKPSESSDWYSSFVLQVPLKSAFSANLGINYSTTAFGNGIWMPVYEDSAFTYGCYGYSMKESERFATALDLTYRYKLFALTASWHANWMDIPAMENRHLFSMIASLQSKEGKWGTALEASYSIDAEDKTPYVDFEAYVQASNSVKFVLSAEDIFKLVTASTREYAGKYIAHSGNVTLAVKFLF